MQAATAQHAVRLLAVDVANLSARCAMYQAAAEEILLIAQRLDSRAWERSILGEGENTKTVTMLPPDQLEALDQLLDAIDGLR
jgi:hypothetical protein